MDARSNTEVDGKADNSEEFQAPVCSICLGAMANPQAVTECNHRFCETCLSRWLRTQRSSQQSAGTCPVCRSTITEFRQPQRLERRPLSAADREAALGAYMLAHPLPGHYSSPDREAMVARFTLEIEQYLRGHHGG